MGLSSLIRDDGFGGLAVLRGEVVLEMDVGGDVAEVLGAPDAGGETADPALDAAGFRTIAPFSRDF